MKELVTFINTNNYFLDRLKISIFSIRAAGGLQILDKRTPCSLLPFPVEEAFSHRLGLYFH